MNQNNNYLLARLLALLFILSPGMLFSSCTDPVVEQERNVKPFTGIKVGGAFDVILSQTGKHKLVVEAEEDVLDKVRTEVKGDVLHIEMEWEWSWKGHDDVTIYIDFDQLASLHVSGAGDVSAKTSIRADDMELRVSGAGDVDFEINAESMDVTISGAGDVHVSGNTDSQELRLSGAGDYNAQHLKSNRTYVKVSGAGTAEVYASEAIEAYASGAGSVRYYGNPDKEESNESGAGSVSRR